jgi:hypothetical protein
MMSRPLPRKRSTILVSLALGMGALGTGALAPVGAAAASLTTNSMRISPASSPFVNSLSGGIGAHTDKVWGHGDGDDASPRPLSFAECYRRTFRKLKKRDPSMGYEFISTTARHICGA